MLVWHIDSVMWYADSKRQGQLEGRGARTFWVHQGGIGLGFEMAVVSNKVQSGCRKK